MRNPVTLFIVIMALLVTKSSDVIILSITVSHKLTTPWRNHTDYIVNNSGSHFD